MQQEPAVVDIPSANSQAGISALELKTLIDSSYNLCVVDVRQPEEHQLVRIDPSYLIPLDELAGRLDELKSLAAKADLIVLYCHVGMRSELAVRWLMTQGFKNIKNLCGGVNAYARDADTSLRPY